jgi:hypothetical protein
VQRKGRAVLAAAPNLATDANDLLLDTGLQIIGDIAVMFSLVRLRHEHFHILADELRGAVAKKALRRWVNALDESSVIDGYDDRDRGLEYPAKLGRLSFK